MPVIVRPVVSEKTMQQIPDNRYTFEVTPAANKITIAKEIKQIFKVDVLGVRIISVPGKVKRFKNRLGKQVDRKKAIVVIKAGQKIPGFESGK